MDCLKEHLKPYDNGNFLFRGQNKPYQTIYASAFRRKNSKLTSNALFQHAMGVVSDILSDLLSNIEKEKIDSVIQWMHQHYDHISRCIDLTSNWKVAKWFAQHQFSDHPESVMKVGTEKIVFQRKCISRQKGDKGYIYVFKKSDLIDYGLDDVAQEMTNSGFGGFTTRPIVQHAVMAGMNPAGFCVDYMKLVHEIVEFDITETTECYYTSDQIYPANDPVLTALKKGLFCLRNESGELERYVNPIETELDFHYSSEELTDLVPPEVAIEYKTSFFTVN